MECVFFTQTLLFLRAQVVCLSCMFSIYAPAPLKDAVSRLRDTVGIDRHGVRTRAESSSHVPLKSANV